MVLEINETWLVVQSARISLIEQTCSWYKSGNYSTLLINRNSSEQHSELSLSWIRPKSTSFFFVLMWSFVFPELYFHLSEFFWSDICIGTSLKQQQQQNTKIEYWKSRHIIKRSLNYPAFNICGGEETWELWKINFICGDQLQLTYYMIYLVVWLSEFFSRCCFWHFF